MESQLDWLTGTAQDPLRREYLRQYAEGELYHQAVAGNVYADWHFMGYAGWRCGRLRWGSKADGDIIQLTGPLAARDYALVDPHLDNISRLDAAVTVRQEPFARTLASDAYYAALDRQQNRGRHATFSLFQSSDGGATLYIGKRASDYYARLYNKEAESGDPAYAACWRYEVECKRHAADALRARLSAGSASGAQIAGLVHDHFTRRGVPPIFSAENPLGPLKPHYSPPTLNSRLSWLNRQVRPAAQYLISNGERESLARALGIDPDAIRLLDPQGFDPTDKAS